MKEITIENVVASTDFKRRMPLDKIALSIPNTEYEPEQFPGLVYRLEGDDTPDSAALIFGSGKVVCTGAKSAEEAKNAVAEIIKQLKEADVDVEKGPDITVQNVVASSHLDTNLNLNRIAFELVGTEYEPAQFPGLVYRLDDPKVAFLLFSSGKIVCTGGKKREDVEQGIEKLTTKLKEIGALPE